MVEKAKKVKKKLRSPSAFYKLHLSDSDLGKVREEPRF